MEAHPQGQTKEPVVATVLHDPATDARHHEEHQVPEQHDHATEVAHAREHFRENNFFFLGIFLPVILLTVIAFNVQFGAWTPWVTWSLAALRSGLIAYFLSTLFKNYSFVFRTLFFTFFFWLGMIFLSLWDSEVPHIGNPIYDKAHPESMQP